MQYLASRDAATGKPLHVLLVEAPEPDLNLLLSDLARRGYGTSRAPMGPLAWEFAVLHESTARTAAEALAVAAAAMSTDLDLNGIFDRILEQAGRLIGGDLLAILLIEEDQIRVARSYSREPTDTVRTADFPPPAYVSQPLNCYPHLQSIVVTGKPAILPDISSDPLWVPIVEKSSSQRSFLGVPVQIGETRVGVLGASDARVARFGMVEALYLEAFAAYVGIALKNARINSSLRQGDALMAAAARARGEILQNVSHELRTPLAVISGYIQLLEDGDLGRLNAEQQRAIAVMHGQEARLEYMVNRLLTLQMLDDKAPERVAFDLVDLLRKLMDEANSRRSGPAPQLVMDAESNVPLLSGGPDLLYQVFENLIDNAIKFSPTDGAVNVRVRVHDDVATVTISDHGIGFPPGAAESLFAEFHQGSIGTTRRFGGMGIGLALCRKIVAAHGGRIWGESAGEGSGSAFHVALPLA